MRKVWHTEYKNALGFTTRTRDTYVCGGGSDRRIYLDSKIEAKLYKLYLRKLDWQKGRIYLTLTGLTLVSIPALSWNKWFGLALIVSVFACIGIYRTKGIPLTHTLGGFFDGLVSAKDRAFFVHNRRFIHTKAAAQYREDNPPY